MKNYPAGGLLSVVAIIGLNGLAGANETDLVPIECLTTHAQPAFGRGGTDDTRFDMSEYIAKNMHQDMTLLNLDVCLTEDNKLSSMKWAFADVTGEIKVDLPWAGPRLTNCNTELANLRVPIEKIRVFRSNSDDD